MINTEILIAILAAAMFFAVRYLKGIFAGKGSCCSDSCVTCPTKDGGRSPDEISDEGTTNPGKSR